MLNPPSIAQIVTVAIILGAGFSLSLVLTKIFARLFRQFGKVAIDAHKISKPLVPDMCGIAIWMTLGITTIGLTLLKYLTVTNSIGFLSCISIAALIGAWDDLRPIGPRAKPLLTVLAAIPILIFGAYSPYPRIPFLGAARVTIVYPFLILIAIPVLSNAINMMNPFNCAKSGTCSVSSFTMIVCFLIIGQAQDALFASALLGTLLGFHYYNRNPARVFSGNVGDLCVGSALGALSIMGRIEVPMLIAMIPHISNAFYFLSSVGGLKERRQITARPTQLLDDGRLDANPNTLAPGTLSRLILAKGPLKESEIVQIMITLTAASSILAVFTVLLLW